MERVGADIRVFVERQNGSGTFEAVDPSGGPAVPGTFGLLECWGFRRAYHEFALLGAPRSERKVTPIVPIRTLPNDASPDVRKDHAGDGRPTASWFTLAELQAVDWARPMPYRMGIYYDDADVLDDIEDIEDIVSFQHHVDRTGVIPDVWHDRPIRTSGVEPEWYGLADNGLVSFKPLAEYAEGIHDLMLAMTRVVNDSPENLRAIYWFDNGLQIQE
jgi:hypothetical protein